MGSFAEFSFLFTRFKERKLFKGGNYMRKYGMYLIYFLNLFPAMK